MDSSIGLREGSISDKKTVLYESVKLLNYDSNVNINRISISVNFSMFIDANISCFPISKQNFPCGFFQRLSKRRSWKRNKCCYFIRASPRVFNKTIGVWFTRAVDFLSDFSKLCQSSNLYIVLVFFRAALSICTHSSTDTNCIPTRVHSFSSTILSLACIPYPGYYGSSIAFWSCYVELVCGVLVSEDIFLRHEN